MTYSTADYTETHIKESHRHARTVVLAIALFVFFAVTFCRPLIAQSLAIDREKGQKMLRTIGDDLKKYYYDETIRGMDVDARFKQAEDRIKKAQSTSEIMGIIAQVLLELNDSHTFFLPPERGGEVDYGWQMRPVGDDCYVSAVKPGSDAAAMGIAVGDRVISIDDRPLSRDKVWLAHYLYDSLRPQPAVRLVIRKPDGQEREVNVKSKLVKYERYMDNPEPKSFYELSRDVLIWKLREFDLSEEEISTRVGKFRNRKSLIVDLRGNGGGYRKSLECLAGYLFEHDVKIADAKGRKELKPMIAKGRGDKAFKGELIVLIDGESASAAEVFARLVQLNKRGIVIGDRSAGMVMQSRHYSHQIGVGSVVRYGVYVTQADLLMMDGKSLEHTGVTPDEVILPSPADMSAGRDPVLARAATLAGATLDPQKAGSLFPLEWKN